VEGLFVCLLMMLLLMVLVVVVDETVVVERRDSKERIALAVPGKPRLILFSAKSHVSNMHPGFFFVFVPEFPASILFISLPIFDTPLQSHE